MAWQSIKCDHLNKLSIPFQQKDQHEMVKIGHVVSETLKLFTATSIFLCMCACVINLKGHSFYNLFIFTRMQGLADLSSSLNMLNK